ncbi:MAG: hypothetical protein QM817_00280 [Archangium sp.]
MNSLSNRIEALIDDPRVRIAGPVVALAVTVGFLIFGNVVQSSSSYAGKVVSVLPDQPLNLGASVARSEVMDGAASILAWQQPAAKPAAAKPAAANAKDSKAKGKKGTLTARR